MKFKSYKIEMILIGITVFAVAFAVFFNDINRYIRIKELKIFLQRSTRHDNNTDHIGLIMKYRTVKRLYEKQITQENADLTEMQINAMLTNVKVQKRISVQKYDLISRPAIFVINSLRFIMGKIPIVNLEEDKSNVYMDIAYYYERNKYYAKAIKIYEKALADEPVRGLEYAGIVLHQGFCYSIIGEYDKAKKKYKQVIRDYSKSPIALTATILLEYIERFKSEVDKIMKSDSDSINKGERLYNLLAYKESLNVLKKIENSASPSDRSRIQYYKARCYEEVDQKEKAISTYQNIILTDTKSKYAKMANRRIYITAVAASPSSGIKELAEKNNQLLEDKIFSEMAKEYNNIRQKSDFSKRIGENGDYQKVIGEFDKNILLSNKDAKPVEKLIKMVDEKLKKKGRKYKAAVSPQDQTLKIYTMDGNVFIGKIQSSTSTYIQLMTKYGMSRIMKDRIRKIEKVR